MCLSLKLDYKIELQEYITALSWSKNGTLAVSSAEGEVMILRDQPHLILTANEQKDSIDCLDFSFDSQYLAVGRQDGQVIIWQLSPLQLIDTLNWDKQWIQNLAWHPQQNHLAFSQGRYVEIWDIESQKIITTLAFENSSVLDLAWNPQGEFLAVAGNGGVKIWDANNWDDDPFYIETDAAALKIAWSKDGEYLAVSSLDNIIFVWGGGNLVPWRLSGFRGKIRNLTWSQILSGNVPILAISTMENIIIWEQTQNEKIGWSGSILKGNHGIIQDLQFHPENLLLVSGDNQGNLLLWENKKNLRQNLKEITGGFSCLKWDNLGQKLATGSDRGEIAIFRKVEI
jgi:WD40 repeat protein